VLTVLAVIGTRPEAVKMAPVVAEMARHDRAIRPVVCVTGQHREMLDQALDLFGIVPDVDLKLMEADQSLAHLTSQLLARLDEVVEDVRPDWILAQGDTTTVMGAALVAYYRDVAFGHVEAGLRTGDRRRPFPEEVNRRIADDVADALFAPTEHARAVLLRAGAPPERVFVTGNTGIDALLAVAARPYDWARGPLARLRDARPLVLVTAHRRESFGAPLAAVCDAVRILARRFAGAGAQFVYPVHLNPNVSQPVTRALSGIANVTLTPPLDYVTLTHLLARCALVLTDSGGIQEEAPSFGVPVLVLREKTERPEGIDAGVATLVGTDRDRIVREASRLLARGPVRSAPAGCNPYGDGHAARRIVEVLLARPWETATA
jgi:UDP-N-acetylglucosamine 2-epimerase